MIIEDINDRDLRVARKEICFSFFDNMESSKYFVDLYDFLREFDKTYIIKGIKPLRLKIKDNTYYVSKIWSVDNPRYFLLRAAVDLDGPAPFSAIRRNAVKLAIQFFGEDELLWNKKEFIETLQNLGVQTLKEFCKHNPYFELKNSIDREWSIKVLDPNFSFNEYEETELRRIQSSPGVIKKISIKDVSEQPEEVYTSPEIDWDAIERATQLKI